MIYNDTYTTHNNNDDDNFTFRATALEDDSWRTDKLTLPSKFLYFGLKK